MSSKRDLVLNCVSLGMDLQRAYYAAELTPDEMDELEKDEAFQRTAKAKEAIAEMKLLQSLDSVIEMNLRKGNSKELRYKLGAISPKWRNTGGSQPQQGGTINIFTKNYNVDEEDTVTVFKGTPKKEELKVQECEL